MRRAFDPTRQHKADPERFWWHYKEIEKEFGRGKFDAINDRLRLFAVSKGWSINDSETRRFKLTPNAERLFLDMLNTKRRGRLGVLLDAKGRVVQTLPRAVVAKDVNGTTAKVWRGEPVPRLVPVFLNELDKLVEKMADSRQEDLFIPVALSSMQRRLIAAANLRKMATTSLAGHGFIAHRYQETRTGRLSAVGTNLQSAPRTVRKAALSGLWDYDFENCHYAIVEQMAARYGCDCPSIQHYLTNKRSVRESIATDIDAEIGQVKRALIAVIYGARASDSRFVALHEAMGDDRQRTRRLLKHPLFVALHREVKAATVVILARWPVRRKRLIQRSWERHLR